MCSYKPTPEELDHAEIALIAETGYSAEEVEFERSYCCCGDLIEYHDIGSGHSPVSMWDYAVWSRAGGRHG